MTTTKAPAVLEHPAWCHPGWGEAHVSDEGYIAGDQHMAVRNMATCEGPGAGRPADNGGHRQGRRDARAAAPAADGRPPGRGGARHRTYEAAAGPAGSTDEQVDDVRAGSPTISAAKLLGDLSRVAELPVGNPKRQAFLERKRAVRDRIEASRGGRSA